MAQSDLEIGFVLLAVPALLLLWVYYGKRSVFQQLLARGRFARDRFARDRFARDGFARDGFARYPDVAGVLYEYTVAFLLMFVVPFVVMTVLFRWTPRELGLQWGDLRLGGRVLGIGLPLALLAAFVGSADPAMQAEYPLAKSVRRNSRLFLLVEGSYLIYYLGWEFLFRGVMLFTLHQRSGALLAVLVQMIPSAIVHIGKPAAESFSAILAGVLFGYVALETRSIVYPIVLHAAIGIATDVFVVWRWRRAR